MPFFSRSSLVVCAGLMLGIPAAGCSVASESSEDSSSAISTVVHEPQAAERQAVFAAFRAQLAIDLHHQTVAFNATNPVGRYQAHGDWAYFEGILEGPDGNHQPIDYANSTYSQEAHDHLLGGVQRNGAFAAKFQALAHRDANGVWSLAKNKVGTEEQPAYVVGSNYAAWEGWASIPTVEFRDIFAYYPHDDLHTPEGAEREAILAALGAQVTADVHGQAVSFVSTDPGGSFLAHDGWAHFQGIVVGPNDNAQSIDYRNSVYSAAGTSAFKGELHNFNFAASCRALLKKNADGSWKIAVTTGNAASPGYFVGASNWVGDPESTFAWDIFAGGEGDGDGDGDGR